MKCRRKITGSKRRPRVILRRTCASATGTTHTSSWNGLNLAGGSDDFFLRFIEALVHPLVVTDETEALTLVAADQRLARARWFSSRRNLTVSPANRHMARSPLASCERLLSRRRGRRWIVRLQQCVSNSLARRRKKGIRRSVISVREVMITLAQAVIDPAEAIREDGKPPSETDAAQLLDVYIGKTLIWRRKRSPAEGGPRGCQSH